MKAIRFAPLFFALAATAQAQTIHNAPQGVTAYADPSQWPFISGQCHWAPSNNPVPNGNPNPTLGHTHVEVNAPLWAEIGSQTLTIPITVRLFKTTGKIVAVWAEHSSDIVWDATGTTQMPDLSGDPNGLKTWTGHLTYDPLVDKKDGYGPAPLHGWFGLRFFARTAFDNGDQMSYALLSVPIYSIVDVTAPERIPSGSEGIDLRASCTPFTSRDTPIGSNGSGIVQIRDQSVPVLAPMTAPVAIFSDTYNYGPNGLPPATYQLFLDSDLHMNIPGTLLVQTDINANDKGTENGDVLDPAIVAASTPPMGFAPNEHRLSFTWKNPTGNGGPGFDNLVFQPNETLVALLVLKVKTAGSVVPSANFPPAPVINQAPLPQPPPPVPQPPPPVMQPPPSPVTEPPPSTNPIPIPIPIPNPVAIPIPIPSQSQ